jgi:enoyl-CoA hydratase/carnithine racemase
MVSAIKDAIDNAPGSAVVIGSSDPAAFSSGADLDLAPEERAELSDLLYELYEAIRASPVISLAAAQGHAVGGGAQLMLSCDLRIVGPDTAIRFAGAGHGLAVGAWGLPTLVGRGRALDLCLSMRPVEAEEALRIGLVDRVADDPLHEAIEYATELSQLDSSVLSAVKAIVAEPDRAVALRMERARNAGWDGSIAHRPVESP